MGVQPSAMFENEDNDKGPNCILVNQNTCWRKIIYNFGSYGPEILFFCHQDPTTK